MRSMDNVLKADVTGITGLRCLVLIGKDEKSAQSMVEKIVGT